MGFLFMEVKMNHHNPAEELNSAELKSVHGGLPVQSAPQTMSYLGLKTVITASSISKNGHERTLTV